MLILIAALGSTLLLSDIRGFLNRKRA